MVKLLYSDTYPMLRNVGLSGSILIQRNLESHEVTEETMPEIFFSEEMKERRWSLIHMIDLYA